MIKLTRLVFCLRRCAFLQNSIPSQDVEHQRELGAICPSNGHTQIKTNQTYVNYSASAFAGEGHIASAPAMFKLTAQTVCNVLNQALPSGLQYLHLACVLQDKDLAQLRLQAVTAQESVAALRAEIRAEEEARAVAHQVAVRAVAAACAQEEARLAALTAERVANHSTNNQVYCSCPDLGNLVCCPPTLTLGTPLRSRLLLSQGIYVLWHK